MAIYATIQELIDSVKDMEVSYRNLHTNIYIKNTDDEIIKIPYKSLLREYRTYFEDLIVEVPLTPAEVVRYRFKPKLLSYDLYGTTELWANLLEINFCYSVVDFNFDKVKVYDPTAYKKTLNEVMILEGVIT